MIDHQLIAETLESARRRTETIEPVSGAHSSFDVADAYEVARRISIIRTGSGDRVGGVKIGFTYVPSWGRIGVEAPFWAPIYRADEEVGQPLKLSELTSPRLEPEVIVGIGATMSSNADTDEIASAIDWIALGFEVVDSHFPDWRASPADLIADQGCHAGLRIGRRVGASFDVVAALRDLTVDLICGAEVVEIGSGRAVLGGPIEAVIQLMRLPNAPHIEAGDVISTGSLTGRSHAVATGQRWAVAPTSSDVLPSVELRVE